MFASTQKLGVTFASPVKEGGQITAVVGGDIALDEIVRSVQGIHLRSDGYASPGHPRRQDRRPPASRLRAQERPGRDARPRRESDQQRQSRVQAGCGDDFGHQKYLVLSPVEN